MLACSMHAAERRSSPSAPLCAALCTRAAAWLLTAASAIDATHRPTLRGCWPRPGDAQRAMGDQHGPPQAHDLYGAHSRACLKTADFALLVRHVRVD